MELPAQNQPDPISHQIAEQAEILQNGTAEERLEAVKLLGRILDDRISSPLLAALDDPDNKVKQEALRTLGRRKVTEALPIALKLLDTADNKLRWQITHLIGLAGDFSAISTLLELIKNSEPELRLETAKALNSLVYRKTSEIIADIANQDNISDGLKYSVSNELNRRNDSRALQPLIELLNSPDSNIRDDIAYTLGELDDKLAAPPLLRLLETETDPGIRYKTVMALGMLKDSRAFNTLVNLLDDKNEDIRCEAIEAFGELKDKRAIEYLVPLLQDKNNNVRYTAAAALDEFGDERAFETLLRLLKDDLEGIGYSVADALGQIGDKRVVEPLIEALELADAPTRSKIATALDRLGDQRAIEPLLADETGYVRADAAEALGSFDDKRSVEPLIRSLKDPDMAVRRWASESLGRIGDPRAIPALEVVAQNDTGQHLNGVLVRDVASQAVKLIKHRQIYNY